MRRVHLRDEALQEVPPNLVFVVKGEKGRVLGLRRPTRVMNGEACVRARSGQHARSTLLR